MQIINVERMVCNVHQSNTVIVKPVALDGSVSGEQLKLISVKDLSLGPMPRLANVV